MEREAERAVLPVPEPKELKIEITDACGLDCAFCYQGERERRTQTFMAEDEVLRWIDWAEENGIPGVRFTGGEATLHPQIEMFCYYARLRGRYIILNTNGMASGDLYGRLFRVVNDVRVSLPTLDAMRMDTWTGGSQVLKKKKDVIGMALSMGVPHVSILTPLTPELHGKLEGFVRFVEASPGLSWLPLRYESTPALPYPWTQADAQAFAEEMADLMDRYPSHAKGIYLAMPFCGVKPMELGARVFHGRTEDCGPFAALNVNAGGRLQACFDTSELGGKKSLLEIGSCEAMRAYGSVEALPRECRVCAYVARCAGGCRKAYGLVRHGGQQVDYLAGFL